MADIRDFRSDNSPAEAIPGIFWHTFTSKDRYCGRASCIIWGVLTPGTSSLSTSVNIYIFYIVLMGCKQSVRGLDRSVWLPHVHQCRCVGWTVSAAVSSLDSHEGVRGCSVGNSLLLCILLLQCDAFSIPNCASGWHKYLCGMWGFSSPPLASSPQYYFQGGNSTLTYLKITTTTKKETQTKKFPPRMTEFVTIIKYGSYSSGCVSPAKSYCSQHHMVAFFFPF